MGKGVLDYHKSEALQKVVEFTLNRGKPFLSPLSPTEIDVRKRETMIDLLREETKKNVGKNPQNIAMRDYVIISQNLYDSNPVFELIFKERTGLKKMQITVSEKGYLIANRPGAKQIQYSTFFDLIRANDLD